MCQIVKGKSVLKTQCDQDELEQFLIHPYAVMKSNLQKVKIVLNQQQSVSQVKRKPGDSRLRETYIKSRSKRIWSFYESASTLAKS